MKLNGLQIQDAIKQLIAEYKFDPIQILNIVKMGIRTAYRKDYLPNERKAQVHVSIGKDGTIKIFREYAVVDEIEDKEEDKQLLLEDAKRFKEDAEV